MAEIAEDHVDYVGFWRRFVAFVIDSILLLAIIVPLIGWLYGWGSLLEPRDGTEFRTGEILINWVLPICATLAFWHYRQATPGKMLVDARIVDQTTLGPASFGRLVLRNLAYIPSTLVLGIGFLWIAFDERKQAWHDKIARTVVIRGRLRKEKGEAGASDERK